MEGQHPTADSARRRLLRGGFAAPVALTLHAGSVSAASIGCIAPSPGLNPPADTTGWLRVPVYFKNNATNTGTSNYVSGYDISQLHPTSSFLPSGQFYCVAVSGTSPPDALYSTPVLSPAPQPTNPVQYLALRVDTAGNVTGVQGIATAGSAVTGSCWSSFGGTALW